jgi:hypothetical protein
MSFSQIIHNSSSSSNSFFILFLILPITFIDIIWHRIRVDIPRSCSLHHLSLCRYSNEIDCLVRACAEPMFDNRYSLEYLMVTGFHHRDNQDTVRDVAFRVVRLSP